MNDINLTHADCLKSMSDFGMTRVHNICTGAITEVPWGTADWTLVIAFCAVAAGVALTFIGMGITIIRDRF